MHSLIDDPAAGDEEQQRLDEGREVLHLAVAVGVVGVGRAVRGAHGEEGHYRRQQVQPGVGRFGKDAQAARQQAHGQLKTGEEDGRNHRGEGYQPLLALGLFVYQVYLP